jgi:hypothetical protein
MGTASLWMVSTMMGDAEVAASRDRPRGRRMAAVRGIWMGRQMDTDDEMQTAHSDQPRTMDLGIDDGDGEVGDVREEDGESDEADVG